MNEQIARHRVEETTQHLIRRMAGLPVATVSVITDLVFRILRAQSPEAIDTLTPTGVKLLIEEISR